MMKRASTHCILLVASLIAHVCPSAAASLPEGVPVRGWTILSDNERGAMEVIAAAPKYGINQIELSQLIISNIGQLADDKRVAFVSRLADAAHAAGISEVTAADGPLTDLSYYPARFRTGPGGTIDLDNPAFWEWLKADYAKALDRIPGIDGIALTFLEPSGLVDQQFSHRLASPAEKYAALVNAIADVVVGQRHLNLYLRIFPNDRPGDPVIVDTIARIARPEVRLMIKQCPLDFMLFSPDDLWAGTLPRPTIIEYDAAGEFNGQGLIANTWVNDLVRRYRDLNSRPHVIGYTVRTDRLGESRVLGKPGEINLYTLKRASEDRQVTAEQIYDEFITAHYGAAALPDVKAAFKDSADIIGSSLYILGILVDDHSQLDYEMYTPPYGHLTSGRWIDPPILHVGHGINREFHVFRDVVNHIAPAFVKDPRYVPPEYTPSTELQWEHPGEAMDEEYLRYIVTEKDFGVRKAEEAVAHVESARSSLAPGAYADLHNYFQRTLLTARLQRAASSAYFGFRVWCRGPEYRTPYVHDTVQNGLAEIEAVSAMIRDYPVKPPTAAYIWAKDADRAERYFRLIAKDGWPREDAQGIADPDGGMKFPYTER